MDKHESRTCLRCKTAFTCKVGDIANCQCNTVVLLPATRAFLQKSFFDCLCAACLEDLNQRMKAIEPYQFPSQREMLTENLHFYKEDGKWVFTETYHLLRGHCCQSGCRHCPYGYRLT